MKYHCTLYLMLTMLTINYSVAKDDWGKTGHRTTAKIAEKYLTKRAARAIGSLLDGNSIAWVSTFADDIKSDKAFKKFGPWHYVNFEFGEKYRKETAYSGGDILQGIEFCVKILNTKTAAKSEKTFYLKMLIHLIGDLHQPLHVGRAEDKGGNDIQVQWFKKGSNLHRVWDSEMIDHNGMSYTELASNATKFSKKTYKKVIQGTLLDWSYESQNLAKAVYDSAQSGDKLGYRYMYDHFEIVQQQLEKGGARLAAILNRIFG
ncbi:S1/P1 nuclease [Aquimarina sp. W85]|uniref:S1/P1 nuclease n=1 Tax=Aquimarina rhodophyticola TaxID=3342246 RepID=UPI00366A6931